MYRERLRAKIEASMDPEAYTPIRTLDELLTNTAVITTKKVMEVRIS